MPTRTVRNPRHLRPRNLRVAYAGAAVCFTLAALAGAVAAAGATTATIPVVSVSVHDFAFAPDTLTIVKGTQVRFTNTGQALHRVVSDDGTFDTHPLQPGHNAVFEFDTIGVFPLHCEIHPTMKMTVTVVAAQTTVAAPADAPSGNTKTAATKPMPTTLATTGAGTTALSLFGLALILLGMVCLAVGRVGSSPIPAVAAVPSASTIARVMGWENRFDDLLPGRITDALRRSPPK